MITDITREDQLKSMQGLNLPILIAQYWYSQHSSLNFVQDLNHYLHEGQVLSTQGVFVMGKVVSIAGEPTFFVRFATGKMKDLVQHLPHYVGWIAFCRNNQGNVREYSVDRIEELSNNESLTSPIFSMHTVLEGSRFRSVA